MRMVDEQDGTIHEDTVQNIKDLLHASRVILITAMDLAKRINHHELGADLAYHIVKIGDIKRHFEDVQGGAGIIR